MSAFAAPIAMCENRRARRATRRSFAAAGGAADPWPAPIRASIPVIVIIAVMSISVPAVRHHDASCEHAAQRDCEGGENRDPFHRHLLWWLASAHCSGRPNDKRCAFVRKRVARNARPRRRAARLARPLHRCKRGRRAAGRPPVHA
ncbi:monooxygenase family domain protein [Burkholderia pseudomallei MSHR7334]|nr:monooxygenase family domain protein [Burkholderia pseudomallei MSHR7334]